jgi:hypothetical protein
MYGHNEAAAAEVARQLDIGPAQAGLLACNTLHNAGLQHLQPLSWSSRQRGLEASSTTSLPSQYRTGTCYCVPQSCMAPLKA